MKTLRVSLLRRIESLFHVDAHDFLVAVDGIGATVTISDSSGAVLDSSFDPNSFLEDEVVKVIREYYPLPD